MLYLAIIGDFIDSKSISPNERYNLQKELENSLHTVNQKYEQYLVSKFSITLGDEFQGLVKIETPIFHLLDDLYFSLVPYDIRFGLGIGEIFTDINPHQSIGADGPAYWHARHAIQYVHKYNDYGNTRIAIKTNDTSHTKFLNTLIAAADALKSNWRASQLEIFHTLLFENLYEEEFDQKAIGNLLKLSSSALSKRLKSSNLKVYLRLRNMTQDKIREFYTAKENI